MEVCSSDMVIARLQRMEAFMGHCRGCTHVRIYLPAAVIVAVSLLPGKQHEAENQRYTPTFFHIESDGPRT